MRTRQEIEQELLMKERRIDCWEMYGFVPDMHEIAYFNNENA